MTREGSLSEYKQRIVLESTERGTLAALVYFLLLSLVLALVAPPPVRLGLGLQKLVYWLALAALWLSLRARRFPLSQAYLAPFLTLFLCLSSPFFTVACGLMRANVVDYFAILFTSAGLVFVDVLPAAAASVLIWASALVLGQLYPETLSWPQGVVKLAGFQLLGLAALASRRADCMSRFHLHQQDIDRSNELDRLVELRTAELRLAYDELQLSLEQRQTMQVESEKLQEQLLQGEGSTFLVYLPKASASSHPPPRVAAPVVHPKARLLLVEDDAQVRELALRMLCLAGHDVEAADGAEAALAKVSAGQRYQLVVTDVVMPGMDGATLAARIRELQPDCRFLFVSGYTDDRLARFGVASEGLNFLAKPFGPKELCARVSSLLGQMTLAAVGAEMAHSHQP